MISRTEQKTALITGASGGIGRAIAKTLDQNHLNVFLTDLSDDKMNTHPFFRCDLRHSKQIGDLYNWVMAEAGVPDLLVLNAGVGIKEKLYEGDPEKWQQALDVNVMGTLRCIRAFVPQMLERQSGHVIFTSSVAAYQPHPYGGVYSAAKTALEVVAETLRLETLPHLKVTTICPGMTDTAFFRNQLSGASEPDEELSMLHPEDIAADVYYAFSAGGNRVINKIVTRPTGQQF